MRDIKFLAGLGTISIFIGIYCFKAAFSKKTLTKEMEQAHYVPVKNFGRGLFILLGSISLIGGILLIVTAINKIQ